MDSIRKVKKIKAKREVPSLELFGVAAFPPSAKSELWRRPFFSEVHMETLTPIDLKFEDFHRDNPLVYDLFKRFALRAIRSGYEHFSAKTIVERIRWETNIETSDFDFKINNNFTSRYSRLFQKDFPQYSGFFRDRELVSRTRG